MKIITEKTVVLYHVEFDAEETGVLKAVGFLSTYAPTPARLWSTKVEIEETKTMLTETRTKLAAARALLAKRKEGLS